MSTIAGVREIVVRKNVTNANAESPAPTVNEMPNIDEYHFGSSDITQSIEVKVRVMTITTSPDAAHLRRESSTYGERVFANSSESWRIRQAHSAHSVK